MKLTSKGYIPSGTDPRSLLEGLRLLRQSGLWSTNKKPSVFKRLLHDDSIEQEALQITMHKQALIKQEYELKILIVAHYGENVYNEMIMERIRLKKEREKKEREHRLRQKEFMLNIKYGAAIAFVATALIGLGYYLIDKVQR